MWSAQYVLAQGCGWHNGNGSSINIWQDQWLKNDDNLKLITSTIEGLENPILGSREWDIELLHDLFFS